MSDVTEPTTVDPRAPRFGQAITASLLLIAVGLTEMVLVVLVAIILSVAVLSNWRLDVYGLLWRHLARRFIEPPTQRESAAPHRFAKLLGATGTLAASGFILAGFEVVGFAIALAVALLAALAATTGICLGCRMYRQVSYLRRHDVV